MTTGLTTTGATTCPTGGDPAIHTHLRASNAVELEPSPAATEPAVSEPTTGLDAEPNADSWRVEVAARLERYRTRRKPRTPRYPSLLLPFDALESWSRPAPSGSAAVVTAAARAEQDFTFPS